MQVYGAIDPISGDNCFIVAPKCDTACMNVFLSELSKQLGKNYALLCLDNAGWHKSSGLVLPNNIRLFYLPPRTPEMNPIEQLWPEVRKDGFKNKLFKTLNHVVEQLCISLNSISNNLVISVSGRNWILKMF
jgi:transposase